MTIITDPVLSADNVLDSDLPTIARWCGAGQIPDVATTKPLLMISGRLASGKDTVAEAVMRALGEDSVQVSFATALRDEVGELLDVVRRHTEPAVASDVIAEMTGLAPDRVRTTTGLLYQAVAEQPDITPWTRTRPMRLALQEWGTDVRRTQDEMYWVKRGARKAIDAIMSGSAVRITDARFANEVRVARSLGFYAIRLEVDLDIRARRLFERDGLHIDPQSENHPSEIELEYYAGFDLRVSNNGTLDETVAAVLDAFRR